LSDAAVDTARRHAAEPWRLYCGTMPEYRASAAFLTALLCLAVGCGPTAAQPEQEAPDRAEQRHLLIVLDGLRPDYVSPEVMPNLHALGERGVVFTNHHAVYPTVTRVNAASISTGAYPETHGMLGNSVFFPAVDPTRFLSTSDRGNLLSIEAAVEEGLLTAPTLGERLQDAGMRMLVASAGSSGSSYLLNHTVAGGGIIHYEYALPDALGEAVEERLGSPPPAAIPNRDRNRYIVDALLEVGLERVDPAVTVLWLSDPDTTAHANGIGHPTSVAALRAVDEEIGRIQDGLRAAGRLHEFNVWVTSDHGFSTYTGAVDLDALLAPFAGELPDGSPRVVAGAGAIYVRDGDADVVAGIVEALQDSARVGAIFTRDAQVPGTLAFDAARWDHARSADILFSPAWTDAENEYGYRGTSASGGTAGHGSTSPYDIHNTLIAAGPALQSGIEVALPTSNVDFAPTFLYMLGLSAAPTMAGRPLTEAFRDGPELAAEPRSTEISRETPDGRYRATARSTVVFDRRYLDSATAERP
jgi:arylsulfatase A-like enzyme